MAQHDNRDQSTREADALALSIILLEDAGLHDDALTLAGMANGRRLALRLPERYKKAVRLE